MFPLTLSPRKLLWPLFLAAGLTACSTAPRPLGNPELPYPPPRPPEVGDILHMPTGTLVEAEEMKRVATEARIVFIGETHDNPASHRLELELLEAMQNRYPGRVALAMEMFTPAQQEALNRWTAGDVTEKEFLREAGWYRNWQMDFDFYRPLLEYARQNGIRVLGVNADKRLARTLAVTPTAELPEEDAAQIPEMDLADPYQKALAEATFAGHDQGRAMEEGFLRVQTLWDETMARNIAAFLQEEGNRDARLVVVAGGNHVRHGFGIPRRVFRRLPVSYVLVGLKEIVVPEERQDRLMDVTIPKFPMLPYDFLLFAEYEVPDREKVRLGVLLDDEDGAVKLQRIMPASIAEKAGLREGDIVRSLDDEPVSENFDVVYAIHRKQPGDTVLLEVDRDGELLLIEAEFPVTEEDASHP